MICTAGLNRITSLISADLVDGRAGTGTTLPTIADTDLETVVADTEVDVTAITSGTTIAVSHVISSVLGNGSDLTEWQIRINAEATQLSRVVTAAITKTAAIEVTKITLFEVFGQ